MTPISKRAFWHGTLKEGDSPDSESGICGSEEAKDGRDLLSKKMMQANTATSMIYYAVWCNLILTPVSGAKTRLRQDICAGDGVWEMTVQRTLPVPYRLS